MKMFKVSKPFMNNVYSLAPVFDNVYNLLCIFSHWEICLQVFEIYEKDKWFSHEYEKQWS